MNEEDVDRMLEEHDRYYDDYDNRIKLINTWGSDYPNMDESEIDDLLLSELKEAEPALEERKVLALESIAQSLLTLNNFFRNESIRIYGN